MFYCFGVVLLNKGLFINYCLFGVKYRYQFNLDRIKDEIVINVFVKIMIQFFFFQFDFVFYFFFLLYFNFGLGFFFDFVEVVVKFRIFNSYFEGVRYDYFWVIFESDDIYVDFIIDIKGFEEIICVKIVQFISFVFCEINISVFESYFGFCSEVEVKIFVIEICGWKVGDDGIVYIFKNFENEVKKIEICEDVFIDMFSCVIKRSWEENV